ncbi:MAG: SGNH/GDSL hydrolase family protein, partial [Gemmatimonadales bacterium]
MNRTSKLLGATALGVSLVAACHNDELFRPGVVLRQNPLFERYVSMGNSITSGFQSGGINDSVQRQSYASLLADRLQTVFFLPLMNRPGCPPPIDTLFTATGVPHRVGGGTAATCALRQAQPVPPPYISNTAVPGAEIEDGVSNSPGNSNALTTFFLGGLTQAEMMRRVDPTFITVWLGNNDVLGAATNSADAGDTTRITDSTAFAASYDAVLDEIDNTPASGHGVLIGIANVTLIPFFSQGQVYFSIKNTTANFPANFLVGPNCAPSALGGKGDSVLVPFQFGLGLIGQARANPTGTYTLTCTEAQTVQPRELQRLVQAVGQYNATIQARATARGYAYVDPNQLFAALPPGSIPPFPSTSGATAVSAPFGTYFSRDGVHPSALAHKLVANALIQATNAEYGTAIQPIP